ncbi:type III pantothenate kinase [Ectothiorhodospira mobilis]|uniref:Type III pantothenate kinase n=1 Tax=Ectothiorhodospira mobilis TaxID=195064 RepID=A0A1I4PC96_ECTMO|nr:type III pantothenate kinase [Ectothiorhodospira mobilis]SFM25227.1 type III pantothenate kinase [Ectothiorhodospira mobilis]
MRLLLDAGNSRLKWALWDGRALHGQGALEHPGAAEAPWDALLDAAAQRMGLRHVDALWAVEVVGPAFRAACSAWARRRGWPEPRFLEADPAQHGIVSAYRDPGRLGRDRYAALVGARALGYESAVVVDCGTAVTLDRLLPGGRHSGGLILPGLGLMRRGLGLAPGVGGAVQGDASRVPAVCTGDAVAAGTLLGLAAAIDALTIRLGEPPPPAAVLLTGGDAPCLIPHLTCGVVPVPDLVLHGLARVSERG